MGTLPLIAKQPVPVNGVLDEAALTVQGIGKLYTLYNKPQDRLKQALFWRLGRNYGRPFWAIEDVSFVVNRGESVGIIGRNGSGKSTLLQIITGTLHPTIGSVTVNGRISALLELGSGFNPEYTGRENVLMNGAILGFSQRDMQARFNDIAAFAEIGEFIDQPVKTYSSGMYVRLAFSIAIHTSPDILIIDEALAVGDARFQAKCMRRIREFQEAGVTLLFVSHDVSSVRTLCQRAIWLEEGRIAMMGDVFPVTGSYMEFLLDEGRNQTVTLQASASTPKPLPVAQALASPTSTEPTVNTRPVTHWGSHIGTIKSVKLLDVGGHLRSLVYWNEWITIAIALIPPSQAPRETLSVAFSIKDLKGTDLIVSTTFDQNEIRFTETDAGLIEVTFSFRNPLVTGKYLLVAAVEDRSTTAIHYYEYIEGAHYFDSLAEQRFFGVFQPEVTQRHRVVVP